MSVTIDGERYVFASCGHAFVLVRDDCTACEPCTFERHVQAFLAGRPSGVAAWEAIRGWLDGVSASRHAEPSIARMATPLGKYSEGVDRVSLRRALGRLAAPIVNVHTVPIGGVRPFLFYPDDRRWFVGVMPYRAEKARGTPVLRLKKRAGARRR
jgi:hypothetical protein